MKKVIENGPWLIRLVSLILNVWTPNSKLKKDEITTFFVWIKLYKVPLHVPSILGRNTYARALVEVSADKELMDSLVAIPFPNGKGHSLETIEIEYEWEPHRCSTCKIFDHLDDHCPKKLKESSPLQANDDGFVEVTRKRVKSKAQPRRPKELDNQRMPLKNSFAALVDEADHTQPCNEDNKANNLGSDEDESDSEVMETIVLEQSWFIGGKMKSNERSRIIWGWNPNDIDIFIITQDDQVMHARVCFKADKKEMFCSFICAHNRYTHRRTLWNSLCLHKHYVRNRPWCLLGDFNAALDLVNHSAGSSNIDISMMEFKDCVEEIKVLDVNLSGLNFTWNQKTNRADRVLKKIDRIMANLEFQDIFIGAHAIFQPYRISNHSLAVLKIPRSTTVIPKPFKFSNILIYNVRFNDVVKDEWDLPISGFYMIQEVKDAIFSIGNENSPGPNGYTVVFFKEAWDVVANDITRVIQEFFTNGKLLKELNHTIIALIPKDIINLCFANDLFLFGHGDADSAQVITRALDEFKLASGLTPSLPKSAAYFCIVLNHTKLSILNILPFEEGHLFVKYLGVPFISSRLIYQDCMKLIKKVQNRIKDWKKNLFLLLGGCRDMRRGKAKVAWEVVCLPKKEGGLGLRRLDIFNKALM
nr:hypothetical protein [Tanacetum cinerariifolium]